MLGRIIDRLLARIPERSTTTAFRDAIRGARREYGRMGTHKRAVRSAGRHRATTGLKLNLGCGTNTKPGWLNIDTHAELPLDLREPLPFRDRSCAVVYSEHFLEHVDYPDATLRLLRECWRVLEPGGIFSVGVPDTEWPLLEYAGVRRDGYFTTAKAHWHPEWCVTDLEHINFHFRQGTQHRMAYDYVTLERILTVAGFVKVARRGFDPALDDAKRALGTLYAVAVRS